MKRRVLLIAALAALMVLPAGAFAIPRPPGATPSNVQTVEVESFSLNSQVNSVVTSQPLQDARLYLIEISQTWIYNTASGCNLADAAFYTASCSWTPRFNNATRGVVLSGQALGACLRVPPPSGPSAPCTEEAGTAAFRSRLPVYEGSHVYKIETIGRGSALTFQILDDSYGSNNNGSLTVRISQLSEVTYTFSGAGMVPGASVNQQVLPGQTIQGPSTPTITVPSQTIPGGSVVFSHQPNGFYCLTINAGSTSQSLGCVIDPGRVGGGSTNLLPDQTIPLGPGPLTVCGSSSCTVPSVTPPPVSTPEVRVQATVPASTGQVSFSWKANLQRLHFGGADNSFGTGVSLWLPFSPNESGISWFLTQGASVPATITVTTSVAGVNETRSITIDWVGQALEAMFNIKAAGV